MCVSVFFLDDKIMLSLVVFCLFVCFVIRLQRGVSWRDRLGSLKGSDGTLIATSSSDDITLTSTVIGCRSWFLRLFCSFESLFSLCKKAEAQNRSVTQSAHQIPIILAFSIIRCYSRWTSELTHSEENWGSAITLATVQTINMSCCHPISVAKLIFDHIKFTPES